MVPCCRIRAVSAIVRLSIVTVVFLGMLVAPAIAASNAAAATSALRATAGSAKAAPGARGVVIEDFDGGAPQLESYADQDADPDAWEVTADNAYGGAGLSLRLYGNTWKEQTVTPPAVTDTTVWQVAIHCERRGEIQALGIGDGERTLFYTFFGDQLQEATHWWTVYQGAFPEEEWRVYLLPVGEDWRATFGDLPTVTRLVYVNDRDGGGASATLFDAIADVTEDLPHAPRARILYTVEEETKVAAKLWLVSVQFYGEVFDPDSDEHDWSWDFGDSTTSDEQNPQHRFLVQADHPYTVGLNVTDPDGLAGGDTCRVTVEPGASDLPLTVNFVGDVFTGRGFESPGGIIDTYGIEALYEPTREIFGEAADVSVANLEVCYTDRGTPHPTKSVVFRSRPENIVGLSYAGVDVVTIGNNHIIDYGEIGMLDTMAGLDEIGVRWCGAGSSEYLALLPTFWTEQGVRLGFLGLCNRTGRRWNYQPFLDAGYNKPGFAYLLPDNLASSVAYSRELADVVIVQTHSGNEYQPMPPDEGEPGGAKAAEHDHDWPAPPPVESAEARPDLPEFRFRNEPTPSERELRRLVLDLGADVLINHHPHVLQGFESYDGKLIAHSLGNFIFDLYYVETMPTMVLTLEIDESGIVGYRFTPAWINHWIPEPATGQLGREIVDRLADYSRPMGAIVAPLPESAAARIHLSRVGLDSTRTELEVVTDLAEQEGWAVSPPLRLTGAGNLSQIAGVAGDGSGWEVRWGREILWHGNFEDEGADLWDVNTADEEIVSDVAHGGARSLRLRREANAHDQTGTDLERHLPCEPSREHSACGWLRADNAAEARIMVRFYNSRYNENALVDVDLAERFTGTTDWTFQWRDLPTPDEAVYFELRCAHEPPASGTGWSWYDDLALIEWEPWTAANGPLQVPAPNNQRFVQVRSASPAATTATLAYVETRYGDATTTTSPEAPPAAAAPLALNCYPNPFNPRTTVVLDLPAHLVAAGGGAVLEVAVFDLRGRRVATLRREPAVAGRHGVTWDGRDDAGRAVASGTYFVRASIGETAVSRKVALLR